MEGARGYIGKHVTFLMNTHFRASRLESNRIRACRLLLAVPGQGRQVGDKFRPESSVGLQRGKKRKRGVHGFKDLSGRTGTAF